MTHSRGFSPHSATGFPDGRFVRVMQFFASCKVMVQRPGRNVKVFSAGKQKKAPFRPEQGLAYFFSISLRSSEKYLSR